MTFVVNLLLFTCLLAVALAAVRIRDLAAVAMLFGVYSLLSAALFTVMDAPDVAMTEAAVGAGVSTVLMLATLARVGREEARRPTQPWLALTVTFVTGAALLYGLHDLPAFGDPQAPVHGEVARHYLEQTPVEIDIPNTVTAVLASYRGYDTLGETAVIFTAGIGVLALLAALPRKTGTPATGPAAER